MAHINTSKCVSEVYAACQQACPQDAIHYVAALPPGYPSAGQPWMAIDAAACNDCGKCVPACPIGSIVASAEQDPLWATINANLGPVYRGQKASPRARTEAPRRADNQLVSLGAGPGAGPVAGR